MQQSDWNKFTMRVPAGTRVRCVTSRAWYQTWRDAADPRNYPCFGGPNGQDLEGVLWPYTEWSGPKKCDGRETIIVNVHPFNNFDRGGADDNKGLIHPHYDEIQYLINGQWLSFDEVMA